MPKTEVIRVVSELERVSNQAAALMAPDSWNQDNSSALPSAVRTVGGMVATVLVQCYFLNNVIFIYSFSYYSAFFQII
jgi:hypothetical protein